MAGGPYVMSMAHVHPFGYEPRGEVLAVPRGRRVYFNAVLIPNRSLSGRGFLAVMAAIGLISFVAGTVFFLAGAWPVIGFLGLDVLAVYYAFRLNYRSGMAREYIQLRDDALELRRVTPGGKTQRIVLEPAWLTLTLEGNRDEGSRLVLDSRRRRWLMGAHLAPEEREELAEALKTALAERAATLPFAPPRPQAPQNERPPQLSGG